MSAPGTPNLGKPAKVEIPLVAEQDVDPTASLGSLVKDASTQMSTLVRAEIELAKTEITASVKQGVIGAVFFIVGGVIGLFSLWFFWFMVADIFDTFLPRWIASTIVFLLMVAVAGGLFLLGKRQVGKVEKPQKTLDSLDQAKQSLSAAVKFSPDKKS